jgi:hypothetical protein
MKINKYSDILLHVILPIVLGSAVYSLSAIIKIPLMLKNYLPDGLWAYSFISALLIIWNRHFHFLWISAAFLLAACFELLQYFSLVPGTGDMADAIVYTIFFGAALLINNKLKKNYLILPHHT